MQGMRLPDLNHNLLAVLETTPEYFITYEGLNQQHWSDLTLSRGPNLQQQAYKMLISPTIRKDFCLDF